MSTPVNLRGGLTRDPEVTFSRSGTAIANFSIATSRRQKNKDTDEWEDTETTYWDCRAFGQLAENICESLSKGDRVIGTGRAFTESWQDKDGNKRSSMKVIVDDLGASCARRIVKVQPPSGAKPVKKPAAGRYDDEPPF